MQYQAHSFLAYIFGVLTAAVLIYEIYLMAAWNPRWLRSGILIFRKSITFPRSLRLSLNRLQYDTKDGIFGSLVFQLIDQNMVSFREKLVEFNILRYSPIAHGNILIQKDSDKIIVELRLFWFAIILILLSLSLSVEFGASPTIIIVLLFLVLFTIHIIRARNIASLMQSYANIAEKEEKYASLKKKR